jgi:hypothetical protein
MSAGVDTGTGTGTGKPYLREGGVQQVHIDLIHGYGIHIAWKSSNRRRFDDVQ